MELPEQESPLPPPPARRGLGSGQGRGLERAEMAGTVFEEALRTVADLNPEFTLHEASALEPIREQLARLQPRLVRRG